MAEGFFGVFPYLVSPVDADGAVRADVLARLVDDLIRAGVHGLTPLGSTGEFAYLSWDQKARIVDVVLEAAGGRVPVVPGAAATTTATLQGYAVRDPLPPQAALAENGIAVVSAALDGLD